VSENGVGDYFISDIDDDLDDDDLLRPPVVIPQAEPEQTEQPSEGPPPAAPAGARSPEVPGSQAQAEMETSTEAGATSPSATTSPADSMAPASREERLVAALNGLMAANHHIQAAALVSLDGFTMASALPDGMQEDRVGAMSAAILGLGERAAAELGRGRLDQVYIEGSDGLVVLISAGGRAVLTALAGDDARLGLVLYDMRGVADEIAGILS
jgi:predicted regulator of Ras-like GTPase activity (Roadblock/LC7/MglB family)